MEEQALGASQTGERVCAHRADGGAPKSDGVNAAAKHVCRQSGHCGVLDVNLQAITCGKCECDPI